MPLTITWSDGVNPDIVYTVDDDLVSSIDRYRAAIMPVQPDVRSMAAAVFREQIIKPATTMFPTAGILAAKQALAAAQESLETAYSTIVSTAQRALDPPVSVPPVSVPPVAITPKGLQR